MTAITGLLYALGLALTVVAVLAACEMHSRRAWQTARRVARQDTAIALSLWRGKAELAEAELRDVRHRVDLAAQKELNALLWAKLRQAEAERDEAEASEAEVIAAAAVTRCAGCGVVELRDAAQTAPITLPDHIDEAGLREVFDKHRRLFVAPKIARSDRGCRFPLHTHTTAGERITPCGSCDLCVGEGQ